MCEMTPDCDGRTGQLGRCQECGADRVPDEKIIEWDRKTGGAGARTHPLSDEDYRRQMRKIEEKAGE